MESQNAQLKPDRTEKNEKRNKSMQEYTQMVNINSIISCVCVCVCMLRNFSHIQLFTTLWTVAHQALLPMGFSRQEYWSGSHALLQGIFPTQGPNLRHLRLLH